MGAEGRDEDKRKGGDEVEAGGVSVYRWSAAPPRLPLPHPLCGSFTSPRLSVIFNSPSHLLPLSLRSSPSPPPHSSQLKKTKRAEARGESKSRLSHGETERNSDGEQSERRFSFFLSCAKNAQGAACQMWGRPKEESQNDAQNVFFLNGKRQIVYQTPGGRILS